MHLNDWGIFPGFVNESVTFTCKVMGISYSVYEFSPYEQFLSLNELPL